MGGWSCVRGFDTQPAQWGRALKPGMLCSALKAVQCGMYGVVWNDIYGVVQYGMYGVVWNGMEGQVSMEGHACLCPFKKGW